MLDLLGFNADEACRDMLLVHCSCKLVMLEPFRLHCVKIERDGLLPHDIETQWSAIA